MTQHIVSCAGARLPLPQFQRKVEITPMIQSIIKRDGRVVLYDQNKIASAILRSLEANGIAAPAHCRSGECGWCHSKLCSGEVYCPKSMDGRREADYIYGYIHPCCSFPLTDLVIDVPVAK